LSNCCSVIVPNYNGAAFLPELVESLMLQEGVDIEFILVDNGSHDDYEKILPHKTKLIKLGKNYGFAYAVNRGIEIASHQYIFLLNNDMVLEKNALSQLILFMNTHPQYCFVQPKLRFLKRRNVINNAGDFWSIYGMGVQRGCEEVDQGQYDSICEIFSPTGGAVLYRKELFEKVGKFDERFFCYMEDVDLGFRLRLAGYRGVFLPTSVVYHGFRSTSKKIANFSRFYVMRNTLFTAIKNVPFLLFLKYLPQFVLGQMRLWVVGVFDRCLHLVVKSYFHVILNLPYLIRERRKVQSHRKATVKEIDSWFDKKRPFKIAFWEKSES